MYEINNENLINIIKEITKPSFNKIANDKLCIEEDPDNIYGLSDEEIHGKPDSEPGDRDEWFEDDFNQRNRELRSV